MGKDRKGIILAGGSGTRLYPLTQVISKQLMPIYDKPMIYYPLATLMQSGIREIMIISTPVEINRFKDLLGDGSNFGLELSYSVQESPDGLAQAFIISESFIRNHPSVLILGDNIFHGHMLEHYLKKANAEETSTIFGYHVANPSRYGVVEFNEKKEATSIEEKPVNPRSNYAVPGIYFFDSDVVEIARKVKPSARGELEIVDVIRYYLNKKKINVEILDRGVTWLDTGTHDDLLSAAQFIETVERRQGLKVNCPEEIAYLNGWVSKEKIYELAQPLLKSGYGKYLLSIVEKEQ